MRSLIIGGSGGLSGRLAELAGAYYEVTALTRGLRPLKDNIRHIRADRNRPEEFAKAVLGAGTTWDVVFDCICMNEHHARQDLEILSKVTHRLVVISTDSVYDPRYKETPQTENGRFVEEQGPAEQCSYAANKRRMEQVFETYFADSQKNASARILQVTIFRPGHIYGNASFALGCYPEHSRQKELPDLILANAPIALVGGGIYLTQPIFVDDLAGAMLDCVDKEACFQQIFCIGGPKAVENLRYCQ